jgi:hypothetical protein
MAIQSIFAANPREETRTKSNTSAWMFIRGDRG